MKSLKQSIADKHSGKPGKICPYCGRFILKNGIGMHRKMHLLHHDKMKIEKKITIFSKLLKTAIILFSLYLPAQYATGYSAYKDFYPTLTKIKYDAGVDACKEYKIDLNLFAAVGWSESEYKDGAISCAGARGDYQIMPIHYPQNPNALYEPKLNARLGAKYLRECIDKRKGDIAFALAGYNQGNNRCLTKYNGWRSYVLKILTLKETGVKI